MPMFLVIFMFGVNHGEHEENKGIIWLRVRGLRDLCGEKF
jgi:hypothetical protein